MRNPQVVSDKKGRMAHSRSGRHVYTNKSSNFLDLDLIIATLVLAVISGLAWGSTRRSITPREAHDIVNMLLRANWGKVPGYNIDAYADPAGGSFYLVSATFDNPGGGNTIGHFAVDKETGDVWDLARCGRFTSPSVAGFQKTIRARIGLADREYRRVKRYGPGCDQSEEPRELGISKPGH